MLEFVRRNAIAFLALFVALGGTSYAISAGSIGTKELRNNDVRSVDVRDRTLRRKDLAAGEVLGSPLTYEKRFDFPRNPPLVAELPCPAGTLATAGGPSSQDPRVVSSLPMIKGPIGPDGRVTPVGWRVRYEWQGERPAEQVRAFVICAPVE